MPNSGAKRLILDQISRLSFLLVNGDGVLQWCVIIDFPRRKCVLNVTKTGGSTEEAFVNRQDDLNLPIGRPGSYSHLPKLHNNLLNQLTHNQDGKLRLIHTYHSVPMPRPCRSPAMPCR
jgi:hypothetical protein